MWAADAFTGVKISLPLVVIRCDYVQICHEAESPACAAAILNHFVVWSEGKRRAGKFGDIWIYKTLAELADELMGTFPAHRVKRSLRWLREAGYLCDRKNPHNGQDRTLQYMVNEELVGGLLVSFGMARWGLRTLKINVSNVKNSPLKSHGQPINSENLAVETLKIHQTLPYIPSYIPALIDYQKAAAVMAGKIAAAAGDGENQDMQKDLRGGDEITQAQDQEGAARCAPTKGIEKNIYELYAEEIGALTPMVRDKVLDAIEDWGEAVVRYGIEQAALHNARRWAYVVKVCERKAQEGAAQGDAKEGAARCAPTEGDVIGDVWRMPALPPVAPDESLTRPENERIVLMWGAAMAQLEMQLDRASWETWVCDAVLRKIEHGQTVITLVIGVRNTYARDMLTHRLYRNIRRVASDCMGQPVEMRFVVDDRPAVNQDQDMPLFRLLAMAGQ